MTNPCPLCARVETGSHLTVNALAVAFLDAFPVNPGHALVVPRRHVADCFELTDEEQAAILALIRPVRRLLSEAHGPAGYNIGVNVGDAAGQTVAHVHVHVIPRYRGDVPDPRGGIRWVIPGRADYWSAGS